MKRTTFAMAFAALLVFGFTARAQAQAPAPWELNLHVGALFLDSGDGGESDTDVMFGTRLGYNTPSGLGFGGNFDYVLSDADFDGDDIDVSTYLYSAEINYTFATANPLQIFLLAGIGAATTSYSDLPEGFDDTFTDLMIPIGGGIKWVTPGSSWGFRGDVRDNIVLVDDVLDPDEGDRDTEAFHNIELSGGISFFFGS
ncbi:MAG TPA: outer membrane beta-barrel protein [Gemmatimonadota bacterium]|nr:outer membrane beta-barrel protein [Gemmatimonadota bacterium]